MSGQVMYRGGWGSAPLSDECKRTVAGLEARESQAEREARIAEEAYNAHNGIRSDAVRQAAWEENNLRLAMQMAADEGVSPLEVHRGNWGHTKDEFVAQANARMDHEDAMQAMRERRAFEAWQRDNAGFEQEPTRAERIAASREERQRAYVEERRPGVMARRADQARRSEIERIASREIGKVLEVMVDAGLLAEGDGRRG